MRVDPVTLNIVGQAFTSITKEMSSNLMRAAYSTIIREAQDYSTALLDAQGNLVAQSLNIPIHLNSMTSAFDGCLAKHALADVTPDDAFLTNDPYQGAQHLPDIFLFTPIFHRGRLIAFSGSCGHHLDVGGGAAGSLNPQALDIYAEGFRIPAIKVSQSRDLHGGLFDQIFHANIRDPHQTGGDFYAQMAANRTGESRLLELVEKHGPDLITDCMAEILRYAERRMREEIRQMPPGVYHGEDYLDSDVFDDKPICLRVRLEVKADSIGVDFEGTDPQTKGPINSPLSATIGAAQTAVKSVLTDLTVPMNAGCFKPIDVRVPFGSILNPRPPAPVRARVNTAARAYCAVMRALAEAVPDKVVACGYETTTAVHIAKLTETGRYRIFTEPLRSGYGGGPGHDGADVISTSLSNCANTPIETVEVQHDCFRFGAYELIQESGGAGAYRGGFGARRIYEILDNGVHFTSFGDRHRLPAWGLFGGSPGRVGRIVVRRGEEEIKLRPVGAFELMKGDVLVVETGGGGGYGEPTRRDRALIERDLRERRISEAAAREVYGYEPAPSTRAAETAPVGDE